MIKLINGSPLSREELLLEGFSNSPIKRNIKIANQKFPSDFFKDGRETRDRNSIFQSMSKINGEQVRTSSRNFPKTHQEIRNIELNNGSRNKLQINNNVSDIKRREMNTALEYREGRSKEYQEELIRSVLTTARQMKKMIRKHSIELKKDRQQKDQAVVELPPLKLKRGFTTAF